MSYIKPLVTTGLIITPEMAAHIIIADRKKHHMLDASIKQAEADGTLEEKIANHEIPESYYYYSSAERSLAQLTGFSEKSNKVRLWDYFTGTASTLPVPNTSVIPVHMTYKNEHILYIQTTQKPSLFNANYPQPKMLIAEMQEFMNVVFPNNTNFVPYICAIEGIIGKLPQSLL